MKELHPDKGLRIFDIKWRVKTAGPSPNNNERIEVFLLGCDKAISGSPCKGCFNSVTWDKSIAEFSRDPIEVADMINSSCDNNNKYITIGGGEPTDQLEYLLPFIKRLKEHEFHIIMYTWRDLKKSLEIDSPLSNYLNKALNYIDIIIDGEFKEDEKLLDFNSSNVINHFIGSGNQKIWIISQPVSFGFPLKDIKEIKMEGKNFLYELKDNVSVIPNESIIFKMGDKIWNIK